MTQSALWLDGKIIILKLKIAEAFFDRFMGLMGRANIKEDEALLFPKCSSIHTFFMRFPIDVIFTDDHGMVIDVISNLKAWKMLLPRHKARHTIEMQSGLSNKLGIRPGRRLEWGTGKSINVEV